MLREAVFSIWQLIFVAMVGLTGLLYFVPPIICILVAIVGAVLILFLTKRYRSNALFVQILGIVSLFVFPVALCFVPLGILIGSVVAAAFGILGQLFVGPFFSLLVSMLPVLGLVGFFGFWFTLFILKVKVIYEKKVVLYILIGAQIAVSAVVILVMALLKGTPYFFTFFLGLMDLPVSTISTVLMCENLVEFVIYLPFYLAGGILFFIPWICIIFLSWRGKKLSMSGALICLQALVVCIAGLVLVEAVSKLEEFGYALFMFLGIYIFRFHGYFELILIAINELHLILRIFAWGIIVAITTIETIVVVFVYAKSLGAAEAEPETFGGEPVQQNDTQISQFSDPQMQSVANIQEPTPF